MKELTDDDEKGFVCCNSDDEDKIAEQNQRDYGGDMKFRQSDCCRCRRRKHGEKLQTEREKVMNEREEEEER